MKCPKCGFVPTDELTEREKEVITYAAMGWPNKSISSELNISLQTTKNHLASIYYKMGVVNRTEMAVAYIKRNMEGVG